MRRYLVTMLLAAVLTAVFAVTANLVIDPYQQRPSNESNSWTRLKPALRARSQIFKAELARQGHQAAILGTSRAEIGIDPASKEWPFRDVANLASSNQSYEETLELLDISSAKGTRLAVIGLDFFAANSLGTYPPSRMAGSTASKYPRLATAASLTTLFDSYSTVVSQDEDKALAEGWIMRANGQRIVGGEYVRSHGGHRTLAMASEKSYLMHYYPPPAAFSLGTELPRNELNCLYRVLRLSYERRLQVYFFVSPSHARQWESLYQAGLWPDWEEWKRLLAQENEALARMAGVQPYQILDFSGFNEFTTEEFPDRGILEPTMKWYIESSHYSTALGERVLHRLLHGDVDSAGAGFGTPMQANSVEAALARIRLDHHAWRETHTADVEEIEASVRDAAPVRHLLAELKRPPPEQGCLPPSLEAGLTAVSAAPP